jgi:acyl-CoA dehydrogenase
MHDKAAFNAIFDLSETLATEQFYPINQLLDRDEPRFEGEQVVTPAALKPALKAFVEAGFIAAGFSENDGGMQLPSLIHRASGAFFACSSAAGTGNVGLTSANASVILLHGTAQDKQRYLPKMLTGEFSGTMCLSEPNAGSTLSDITTRVIMQKDDNYRLKGNKMWISGGDHDCTQNIIHLVLAKIQDENGQVIAGTKGISLFCVPKFLVNDEGALGERNDVIAAGLNHKMGWRGTTNCLMNFGEGAFTPKGKAGAIGTLVGKPHQGLACMFHMMNDARVMVGLAASSSGYAGYLHALDYAKTRVQGRLP